MLRGYTGCWKHSSQILMHHTVPAAFFQLHLLREFSVPPHLKGAQLDSHVAAVEAIWVNSLSCSRTQRLFELWGIFVRRSVVLKARTHSATPLRRAVEFKVELMLVIVLWLLASTSIFAQRTASRWIFSLLYKPLRWLCKKNPSRSAVTQTLRPQLCHV